MLGCLLSRATSVTSASLNLEWTDSWAILWPLWLLFARRGAHSISWFAGHASSPCGVSVSGMGCIIAGHLGSWHLVAVRAAAT